MKAEVQPLREDFTSLRRDMLSHFDSVYGSEVLPSPRERGEGGAPRRVRGVGMMSAE
ncbi:MAG: hypothetical protein LC732_04100 [Acidobacteria bacterium]|nr:hypothetical protein [Acidobacteriota bacterium]